MLDPISLLFAEAVVFAASMFGVLLLRVVGGLLGSDITFPIRPVIGLFISVAIGLLVFAGALSVFQADWSFSKLSPNLSFPVFWIWFTYFTAFSANLLRHLATNAAAEHVESKSLDLWSIAIVASAACILMIGYSGNGKAIETGIIGLLLGALGVSTSKSFFSLIIPNLLSLLILFLFFVYHFVTLELVDGMWHFLFAVVVLLVGILVDAFLGFGAGAMKLLSSLALWVDSESLWIFLVLSVGVCVIYGLAIGNLSRKTKMDIGLPLSVAFLPFVMV